MYALNLTEGGRILSACVVQPNGKYDGMPIVDILPTGETEEEHDVTNWLYQNGEYIYDPKQKEPDNTEPAKTIEQRVETLEEANAEMTEALDLLLSGVTE